MSKSPTSHPDVSPCGQDLFAGTSYRMLRHLASGGMAEIYEVTHRKLGRRLAAKVLHARFASDPSLVDRMRVEAQVLGRMRHANVVAIMGFGTTSDQRPFVVMEYLTGHTLDHELIIKGHLSVSESVALALQLLSALYATHELGIVHRDIKPSNLFLVTAPKGERILKVLDFGIARVMPGTSDDAPEPIEVRTASGVVMGTPRYVSPEGAQGLRVDGRADLYAAALMLYAMLTGRGPFDDVVRDTAVLAAHAHREPPPPSSFGVQAIPPALEAVVLTALRKAPNERYQTAAEFRNELERVNASLLCPTALQLTNVVAALPPSNNALPPEDIDEPPPSPIEAANAHRTRSVTRESTARWVPRTIGIFLLSGLVVSLLIAYLERFL
ncbi:MAG: serine/threonine-protein kinase [Myxococcales bacterium]